MDTNNFKDLENEEMEENLENFPEEDIKLGVQADIGGMRSIGSTFEFFFSKFVGLLIAIVGGGKNDEEDKPKQ